MRSRIRAGAAALALVLFVLTGGSDVPAGGSRFAPKNRNEQAPERYKVKFQTTKGEFVVMVVREWAPLGADRFYNLVKSRFYDGAYFFRVVRGFVVQFGINGEPKVNRQWETVPIADDPVKSKNRRGSVSFASMGEDSRTTQVFINLANNKRLDSSGFAPFGFVIEGMDEVVDQLYSGYGEKLTRQQYKILNQGNSFLEKSYPILDRIEVATIVESIVPEKDEAADAPGSEGQGTRR